MAPTRPGIKSQAAGATASCGVGWLWVACEESRRRPKTMNSRRAATDEAPNAKSRVGDPAWFRNRPFLVTRMGGSGKRSLRSLPMVLPLRHRQGLRKASGLAAAICPDCYPVLNQAGDPESAGAGPNPSEVGRSQPPSTLKPDEPIFPCPYEHTTSEHLCEPESQTVAGPHETSSYTISHGRPADGGGFASSS
jgi:hypothetical protein